MEGKFNHYVDMEQNSQVYDKLENYLHFSTELTAHKNQYWFFRGQNEDFELIPTIGRIENYNLNQEKELFQNFKRIGIRHLDHQPSTELEWLTIAQHHRLATRLLDWTESAIIALYFAVWDLKNKNDGVVYCCRFHEPSHCADENDIFKSTSDIHIVKPNNISPRIAQQHSLFTLHDNPLVGMGSQLQSSRKSKFELKRMIIPAKLKPVIKENLYVLNINRFVLFPDLDKLSEHIHNRFHISLQKNEHSSKKRSKRFPVNFTLRKTPVKSDNPIRTGPL